MEEQELTEKQKKITEDVQEVLDTVSYISTMNPSMTIVLGIAYQDEETKTQLIHMNCLGAYHETIGLLSIMKTREMRKALQLESKQSDSEHD